MAKDKSTILTILDRHDPDKANIKTIIEITKEYGKIPTSLAKQDSPDELDFELICKLAWYAAKQVNPDVELEEVISKIELTNLIAVKDYILHFLTLTIPEELVKEYQKYQEELARKDTTKPQEKKKDETEK